MLQAKKVANSRRNALTTPMAKRSARRLLMERLEQRHLLTGVVSTDPPPNSHDAPTSTDVAATFDEVITGATATARSLTVHSMLRGQLTGGAATVTAAGQTITFNPTDNFSPGEKVQVTATAGLQGAATAVVPEVWQFRVGVTAGSGQFAESGQNISPSSTSAAAGDLDGDGDLDIFLGTSGGNSVWVNDGSGVLSNAQQNLGNGNSRGSEVGDLDADGDLDAFVANRGTANVVWINGGTGQFTSGQTLGNSGSYDAALGDVDGDGDLDAFVANAFQANRVWLNNGSGSFTDSGQALGNFGSQGVELGDLDGDGDLDAYVANAFQGNRVWTNDGSGTFVNSGQSLGNHNSQDISLGDVDGDGDLDAFVTQYAQGSRVWLNDGSGGFSNSGSLPGTLRGRGTALGDLDGDGDLDAFVANDFPHGNLVWVNDGSGGFTDSGQSLNGHRSYHATLGDLDGDGDLDVFSANYGEYSSVYLNQNLQPNVTLSLDAPTIEEAGGIATVTATLSAAHTAEVTVELGITGTATATADYTASDSQIVIPVGATSGSITITAAQDTEDEPDETVIVDIANVTNAQEAGSQQVTTTITDDDPPKLTVTSLTSSASGFTVEFSADLNTSVLNLYDTQTAGLGPADVVLRGTASGTVPGSLVIDPSLRAVTFIKSGDPLAADTYTVTLRSSTDGFVDASGQLLDGNDDGTEGDDYTGAFESTAPPANAVTIGIPDIVRGPGQEINLPADQSNGIPVTISEGNNVRAVDVRIGYDPALLTVTGATVGADAPAGASVIANTTTPGLAILVFFSTNPLPAGSGNFVNLQATVPATDPSGIYGAQQVLDVHGAIVSDGNDNESPAVEDDAFHLSSFFADVSGNGRINAADASGVARLAALIDSGFAGAPNADPIIVGDVSGNGRLNAADASLLAQFAALIEVPQIPAIPGGIVITGEPPLRPSLNEPVDRPSIGTPAGLEVNADLDPGQPAAIDQVITDFGTAADEEDALPALEDAIEELLEHSYSAPE